MELRRLKGHTGGVYGLAFSPDGRTLASVGDNTLRLWDVATGKEVRRFTKPRPWGDLLTFSPDGKLLAAPGDDCVEVWQAATCKLLRRLGAAGATDLAFSADGKVLAARLASGHAGVWDVSSGRLLREFKGRKGGWPCVALSPDGKVLVAGGGEAEVRRWDVRTGRPLPSLPGHRDGVQALAFSPDGKTLATASGRTLRLWDAATGRERTASAGHYGGVTFVAPSADGRLLATADKTSTCLWDLRSGKLLQDLGGGLAPARGVGLAPDGRTLATAHPSRGFSIWEGRARFWSVVPTRRPPLLRLRDLEGGERHYVEALSADLRVLAFSERLGKGLVGSINVRDTRAGNGLRELEDSRGSRGVVALSPEGRVLVDHSLRLWETATGKALPAVWPCRRGSRSSWVRSLALSAGGARLAVGLEDGLVELWETRPPRLLHTLRGHEGAVLAVSFSPDGRVLASAGQDRSVRLWETATGKQRHALSGHEGKVLALRFALGGRVLVSGSADTTTLVWDVWGTLRPAKPTSVPSPRQADALWADLASPDAAGAFGAARRLAASAGQAARLLGERLRPAGGPDARRVARLLAELDSDDFAARERATHELERLGEDVAPQLREALAGKPSPEVRRRADQLLRRLKPRPLTSDGLRELRAVEVLEHAGGAEARRLLARLAGGAPGARLTQEAKAALGRLGGRAGTAGESPGGRR